MCGRYYIEIDDRELQEICDAIPKTEKERYEQLQIKLSGEVFPTNIVPVQTGEKSYQLMKWGFSGFDKKPVINARSETAFIKPMFRDSMNRRRCLIPATGYYEWLKENNRKTKYRFYIQGKPMYFAGCFHHEQDAPLPSFVILTQAAACGAETVHDRMPLIIPASGAGLWLSRGAYTGGLPAQALMFSPE